MKYIIKFFLLFLSFQVFANTWDTNKNNTDTKEETCEYKAKVKECQDALKNQTSRSLDYICSQWNETQILLQIILDDEFKKIDKKVESYLSNLEKSKNKFFWPDSQKTLIEWVDEIQKKLGVYDEWSFWRQYLDVCWGVIFSKAETCWESFAKVDAAKYFKESDCQNLVLTKMAVYNQIAWNVLALNKLQVDKDLKKKNTQQRRTKYDKLLELIAINIGYMERVRKKTPSFTKNPM